MSTEGARHSLRLRSASRTDLNSNFTCEANNELGTTRRSIELTGRPERPTINSIPQSMFANKFKLDFTVKSFSDIRNVEIQYRNRRKRDVHRRTSNFLKKRFIPGLESPTVESGRDKLTHELSSNMFRVVSYWLTFLEKSSEYELIVKVENDYGWSEPSPLFYFSTREEDYAKDYTSGYFGIGFSGVAAGHDYSLLTLTVLFLVNAVRN